jgi:hypothetical protein
VRDGREYRVGALRWPSAVSRHAVSCVPPAERPPPGGRRYRIPRLVVVRGRGGRSTNGDPRLPLTVSCVHGVRVRRFRELPARVPDRDRGFLSARSGRWIATLSGSWSG